MYLSVGDSLGGRHELSLTSSECGDCLGEGHGEIDGRPRTVPCIVWTSTCVHTASDGHSILGVKSLGSACGL